MTRLLATVTIMAVWATGCATTARQNKGHQEAAPAVAATAETRPAEAGAAAATAPEATSGAASGAPAAAVEPKDKPATAAPGAPAAGEAREKRATAAGPGRATDTKDKDHRLLAGRLLVRVGGGVRTIDGARAYDMTLWVDEQDGRRAFPALAMRAGGRERRKLTSGDHAPAFLIWGRFTKQATIKFAHAMSAVELRKEIGGALESVPGGDLFLSLLTDAKEGDEWVLTSGDNGQLWLATGAAEGRQAPQSPKLVRAVWGVWLGNKPVAPELRSALIDRIDVLGH
jgi:hypothetical protein